MLFTVAKVDLEGALQTVGGCLSSSGADLTTHYLFRIPPKGDPDRMEVLTYSGRVSALCPFVASVTPGEKSAFTVEGWRLREWMKGVPDAAVIKFELDGKEPWLSCGGLPQNFSSLDPQNFPYWDKVIESAKITATLPASHLREALAAAKGFASDDESKTPEVCVCQVLKGTLIGTDKIGAIRVTLAGLGDCALRVHVKDTSGVLGFLGMMEAQDEVEILEHDRAFFLRRSDGAFYGRVGSRSISRPSRCPPMRISGCGTSTSRSSRWPCSASRRWPTVTMTECGSSDRTRMVRCCSACRLHLGRCRGRRSPAPRRKPRTRRRSPRMGS